MPIEKPEVRLSAASLVRRGPGSARTLVGDLAPAIEAYRAGDYAVAAARLAALRPSYPGSVEIPFYLGVSRLLDGNATDAVAALREARSAGTIEFAADVDWYLAASLERTGDRAAALALLAPLCEGSSSYGARACAACARTGCRTACCRCST